jgi:hypothetical protein
MCKAYSVFNICIHVCYLYPVYTYSVVDIVYTRVIYILYASV